MFLNSITCFISSRNDNISARITGRAFKNYCNCKQKTRNPLCHTVECMPPSVPFTQLTNNNIYTFQPSFVEIYLKVTKLCCFNQDKPHFSTLSASCRTGYKRNVPYSSGRMNAPKLSRFKPTGLSCLGCYAGKVP